jgi:hypothetical protein
MSVALFCLLFQQLAMAGYVCPQSAAASHLTAADNCAAMGMATPDHSPAHPTDPRCAEHCVSHVPATSHARAAAQPPLLLPLAFAPAMRAVLPTLPSRTRVPVPDPHPHSPPLALRFCSLLI